MEQRIVDINPIYEEICRLEKLATDRYLDSPGNNPATIRYAAQSNERQRLKHLIEKVPTIDPIHATGACYCRECKYRFTDDCATFYESSQGQFQHIMEDNVFVATAKGESKMREILFRGFHPCEDGDRTVYVEGKAVKVRWVEGIPINKNRYIIVSCFDIKELTDEDCMCLKGIMQKVLPSTVSQYTGLTDKNGVKIFEGDVVRFIAGTESGIFEVKYLHCEFYADWIEQKNFRDAETSMKYLQCSSQIEIIGNIHEEGETK